jgi:Mrp family chromosome partitioning ATPase/capsular polysaccharide biosynthesis protein
MPTDLTFYRAVVRRRWTAIAPVVILLPLVALLVAGGQREAYSATAQVLLTYSNPGASINGVVSGYPASAPDRNVATQTALARNSSVAQQALRLADVHSTPTELLNESAVSSPNDSDLLNFTVHSSSASEAISLATSYAQAYTDYRGRMNAEVITGSLAGITSQLDQLAKARQTGTTTFRTLSHDQQTLLAIDASGTNDAVLAEPAQSATAVAPHPGRSAAIGLLLGITLAVALVLVMERFDPRVAPEDAERRLNLPLLASIPAARSWRRRARAVVARLEPNARGHDPEPLVVLRDPRSREAKAFGVLKSSLEFARLEHDFKSLLVTSPRRYDRQPEIVANLAITLAQAGHRVLLCDLIASQPNVGALFHVDGQPGVSEVVKGRIPLESAVVSIDYPSRVSRVSGVDGAASAHDGPNGPHGLPDRDVSGRFTRMRSVGSLDILPFGGPPPHAGFLGARAVTDLMERLKLAPYDLVLIDAPPLLLSGEAETLSTVADAVIVTLADAAPLRTVVDLDATLSRLPVLALGFISVGAARGVAKGRALAGGSRPHPRDGDLVRPPAASNGGPEHRPAPYARRVEPLRVSPRFVDKLREP